MKKSIITILLAFTTIISNATTLSSVIDSTVSTTKSVVTSTVNGAVDAKNYVDTSGNFRLMYNDLKSGVLALATAFKVGATQILYIIGKKYFLMGIYAWISVLVGVLLTLFFFYKLSKTDFTKIIEEDTPFTFLKLIGSIVFIILSISLVATNLQNAINYTFNPEYYVLQEVINMVKTLKN